MTRLRTWGDRSGFVPGRGDGERDRRCQSFPCSYWYFVRIADSGFIPAEFCHRDIVGHARD